MGASSDKNYSVYKHIFPNNKIYIGITSMSIPEKRWANGRGYHNQPLIYNAINKYGWDNIQHEILFANITKEEAEQKEIELISKYQSNNKAFGYNVANGGNCIGTVSDETKNKIAQANKGNQYGIGHKVSEETRNRISKAMIGNQHGKGQKMSEEMKRKLAESHRTENFRRKLSEANKGKKHSEEAKKKMSELHKGCGSKKVVCVETRIIYESILDAAKKNMIKGRGHISACCKGTRKTAGGYHWEYYKEVT